MTMSDPTEPEVINAAITFADANGRRWLTGAHLARPVAEGDSGEVMPFEEMPDRILAVVGFSIVRREA